MRHKTSLTLRPRHKSRTNRSAKRDDNFPKAVLELRGTITKLLAIIAEYAGAEAAGVRLFNGQGQTLELFCTEHDESRLLQAAKRVTADCGACGKALKDGRSLFTGIRCACIQRLDSEQNHHLQLFVAPLRDAKRVTGVIKLFMPIDNDLPKVVQSLLETLGEMMGLAIDKAHLTQAELEANLAKERNKFASEIHDALAQNITCMRMRANLLRNVLENDNNRPATNYLNEIDDALKQTHLRIRELITYFHSESNGQDLVTSLRDIVASMQGLASTSFVFELDKALDSEQIYLPREQATHVYYIIREAVLNSLKHAQAQHSSVRLSKADDGYMVSVVDDGLGFAGTQTHTDGHYGLKIMQQRANEIGGRLEIISQIGNGCELKLYLPC